jgi:hypothetical protein
MRPAIKVYRWLSMLIIGAAVSGCQLFTSPTGPITREQAVTLAQEKVAFEPTSTEVRTGSRQSQPVWIVRFTRDSGIQGVLGQFSEVAIDRSTGEVVTIAIN